MEDAAAERAKKPAPEGMNFEVHYQNVMSAYWIGGMYETFRFLRQRGLIEKSPPLEQIFSDLELVRMPLEKHEIAKDVKFLDGPLLMVRQPPNGSGDNYLYKPDDNSRAHIMPSGLSARGSMMWQVIDLKANTQRWVERRGISDKILDLWGREERPEATTASTAIDQNGSSSASEPLT